MLNLRQLRPLRGCPLCSNHSLDLKMLVNEEGQVFHRECLKTFQDTVMGHFAALQSDSFVLEDAQLHLMAQSAAVTTWMQTKDPPVLMDLTQRTARWQLAPGAWRQPLKSSCLPKTFAEDPFGVPLEYLRTVWTVQVFNLPPVATEAKLRFLHTALSLVSGQWREVEYRSNYHSVQVMPSPPTSLSYDLTVQHTLMAKSGGTVMLLSRWQLSSLSLLARCSKSFNLQTLVGCLPAILDECWPVWWAALQQVLQYEVEKWTLTDIASLACGARRTLPFVTLDTHQRQLGVGQHRGLEWAEVEGQWWSRHTVKPDEWQPCLWETEEWAGEVEGQPLRPFEAAVN